MQTDQQGMLDDHVGLLLEMLSSGQCSVHRHGTTRPHGTLGGK